MTRKNALKVMRQPDYLMDFEFREEPVLGDEKYQAIKNGLYDLEREEKELGQVLKDLGS